MNRTLCALSLAACSLTALQAHAATSGDDSYYPNGMRASTGADASAAAAAGTAVMTLPARSSYVWRGNEAGLTLETGPAATGAEMKGSQAMPQPSGAARREPIFLGA